MWVSKFRTIYMHHHFKTTAVLLFFFYGRQSLQASHEKASILRWYVWILVLKRLAGIHMYPKIFAVNILGIPGVFRCEYLWRKRTRYSRIEYVGIFCEYFPKPSIRTLVQIMSSCTWLRRNQRVICENTCRKCVHMAEYTRALFNSV